jgi:hypothetical protein
MIRTTPLVGERQVCIPCREKLSGLRGLLGDLYACETPLVAPP